MASTGSVQQTGKNSWKLTVSGGFDGAGKRIRHTKTVRVAGVSLEAQEKDARRQLALFISEIDRGQAVKSGKMTLNEFFEYWLKNYAEGRHEPKTIAYNNGYFKRIRQALGHKQIDKIEPRHLLQFYKNLTEPIKVVRKKQTDPDVLITPEYLSPNTIRKYHVLLHTLFKKATQWQFTAYNPADKVEPPKTKHIPKTIYDQETTGRFLLLLEGEELRYRIMALMSLSTGLRRGELFGLQWRHFDAKINTLHIEQASQYLPGKGTFTKPPKNESSKRIVTVPESIGSLLKQYKVEQLEKRLQLGGTNDGGKWLGAENPENDFMFTRWNGAMAPPDSMNDWLARFIKTNNLPPISPHSFRHMAATYLITSGTDLRTVAGKLGHSSSTTTQLVYSHLLKSAERETANKMEDFMQQATDKAKQAQKKQAK